MSMSDPIADMLTRIRNAQTANKAVVGIPASKVKVSIAKVLDSEGYIGGYDLQGEGAAAKLNINLKYYRGKPVIEDIGRISRPGLRQYRQRGGIPKIDGGLGIAVVSTSKGVMTDREARSRGVGGEVLCYVI